MLSSAEIKLFNIVCNPLPPHPKDPRATHGVKGLQNGHRATKGEIGLTKGSDGYQRGQRATKGVRGLPKGSEGYPRGQRAAKGSEGNTNVNIPISISYKLIDINDPSHNLHLSTITFCEFEQEILLIWPLEFRALKLSKPTFI